MNLLPPPDEMTRAFLAGDASFDGAFWAGVTSTGIFCRPSCPARKPRPENLEFFASPAAAVAAGYRACRRCDPAQAASAAPEWIRPLLSLLEREPGSRVTNADVARLGIEPGRVRRWFLAHRGTTFSAFARARRLQAAQQRLRSGAPLDDVALGSGWESHSGFRDAYARKFGGPPGRGRHGDVIVTRVVDSPLGPLRLGCVADGICQVEFNDPDRLALQERSLGRRLGLPSVRGDHPHLGRLEAELGEYFAGRRRAFTVPVVAPGTPFQESVWAALRRIPHGGTWSYAELAEQSGHPGAHRAVGTANGANRVAIVIPCHRVVNTGGGLGGYSGGLWRKHWLLALERRA